MSFASVMTALSASAWYRMGEASGTTMVDSSGNARDGIYTAAGGIGYSTTSLLVGDANTCIDFVGNSSAFATILDAAWMDGTTLSLHMLINADVVSSTPILIERDNSTGGADRTWEFRLNAGKLEFFFWDTGGTLRGPYVSTTTISTVTTCRVGVTYDGTTVRFYLNGVPDGTATISTSGIRSTTMPMQIARHISGSTGSLFYNGRLDEIGVWVANGTVLTAQNYADLNAAALGAQTIAIGQATETDSALPITVTRGSLITAGLATETDTALTAATKAGALVTVGQATETDTAQAVNVTTIVPITVAAGQATETDTALAVSALVGAVVAAGQASETDTALAATRTVGALAGVGQTTETDTALPATVESRLSPGQATETDTALTVTVDAGAGTTLPVGLATEIDTAFDAIIAISNLPFETAVANRADGIEIEADADADWEPAISLPPPSGQADLVVVVVDEYDRSEGFPRPVTREVRKPRERIRIMVAGADWTNREGIPALCPDFQRHVPLLHGPGTWRVPQFHPGSDDAFGVGRFKRIQEQKPVVVQSVDDDPASETYGQVTKLLWKGFIQALDPSDPSGNESPGADVELAGDAHGRAVMAWHPAPLVKRVRDVGGHIWNVIVGKLRRRMTPRIPHIGIDLASRGGTYVDEYLNEQLSLAVDRETGVQWTVMPNDDGAYELVEKDYETVHWTIYRDGQLNKGHFTSDLAEQLNQVYADAIAPDGHYINFAIAPRLQRGSVPPYPFADHRTFGVGTTDADTDTGNGITALLWRLTHLQKLHRVDLPGGYDSDVADAVRELREVADFPESGEMSFALWDQILWDNLPVGYSDEWAHIRPAVQRHNTEKFIRSGSGAIIGRNPGFDEHEILRAAAFSMGQAPSTRQVLRAARNEMSPVNRRSWVGEITLNGGVIIGEHNPGDPIDASMIADARDVIPTDNVWDPWWDGGTLFQVGHSQVSNNGRRTTLMVDTEARDSTKIWAIWDRARENRDNLARGRARARASTQTQDGVTPWDRISGATDRDWDLVGGEWTEVVVPSGSAGTLNDIDIQLDDPREFAMIVGPERLPIKRLNRKIQPLASPPTDPQRHHVTISGRPTGGTFTLANDDGDETSAIAFDARAGAIQAAVRGLGGAFSAVTVGAIDGGFNIALPSGEADLDVGSNDLTGGASPSISVNTAGPTTGEGAPWYGQPGLERWLKTEHGVLYTAGWSEQPCGYGSYVKNDGNGPTAQPLTGHHTDTAGVEYEADDCALYAYFWVGSDVPLPRQQVFRQQLSGV